MRVDIRDAGAVSVLRPLEVASYLRASDWKQIETKEGRWAVWTRDDDTEALLPLRTDAADFALRMGDLLRVLSCVEDRSQSEVFADLLTTNADVVRMRLVDDDLADGSMPIDEYQQAAQKTRDLVLAAACAAINPRAVWSNRKPDKATEYLRGVRMGQSERGSYVLKVISRVPPKLVGGQASFAFADEGIEEDVPYERAVMSTLAEGLRAADSAAESAAASGTFEGFEAAISRGLSANFCEALVGLSVDNDARRTLDVSFTWSRTRPAGQNALSRIVISQDRIPYLQEAARVLRERSPVDEFELRGPVIKLERVASTGSGYVTVHAPVDARMKRVRLELPEADYQIAVEAHRDGSDIACTGRLVRQGRSLELINCTTVARAIEE